MKKYFLFMILLAPTIVIPPAVLAQWTKTILPDPPYGHGSLPGRVNALAADGSSMYAGTLGGNIYLSLDDGTSWTLIDSGLTNSDITAMLPANGSLYVGAYGNVANATYGSFGQGSGLYMTSDSGRSWRKAGASLADSEVYTITGIDSDVVVGTWGGGTYVSSDRGATWIAVGQDQGLTSQYIRTLAVGGIRIFAGTWGDGVFFSDDHGQSWTQSNLGINNLFVNSIITDGPNVYMGNTEGVYKSTDGGFSWTLQDSGLATNYVNTFILIKPNLILGTSGEGVFVSADNGQSWMRADTGLTDGYIYCFAYNGSRIFAGSVNGEVWSRPIGEIVTEINNNWRNDIAASFKLEQNYPNPFNPSTRISYELKSAGHVRLSVFDVSGKLVATLIDRTQIAGHHDITFDGSHVASGVYMYRIEIGSFVSTRKMVLIK